MESRTSHSLFEWVAQTGIFVTLGTGALIVLKPLVPDVCVEWLAKALSTNFDTLAQAAVYGLSVLGVIGLGCCLASMLVQDS